MSDANEEKEPNNAKRGREEEKAVPIQQDVKICNHRTPPKAKSLSRNTFSTSSSWALSRFSPKPHSMCVSRERKERERDRCFSRIFEKRYVSYLSSEVWSEARRSWKVLRAFVVRALRRRKSAFFFVASSNSSSSSSSLCVRACVLFGQVVLSSSIFSPKYFLKHTQKKNVSKNFLRFRGKEKAALLSAHRKPSSARVTLMKISASLSLRCFYLSKLKISLYFSPHKRFLIQRKWERNITHP